MYANQTDLVTRHILLLCMFLILMEENKLFSPAQLKLNKGTYIYLHKITELQPPTQWKNFLRFPCIVITILAKTDYWN